MRAKGTRSFASVGATASRGSNTAMAPAETGARSAGGGRIDTAFSERKISRLPAASVSASTPSVRTATAGMGIASSNFSAAPGATWWTEVFA